MRPPTPILLALTFLTSSTTLVLAGPYPRNAAHDYNGSGFLMPRQCESYCGYGDAYCCTAGQVCFTNAANIASCGAQTARVGGDGSWNYYTTTIVDSVAVPTTRVVTMSSWVGQPVAASSPYIAQSTAICFAPLKSCGSICCASNQYCHTKGQCKPLDGAGPQPTTFVPPDRGTTVVVTTVPVTTTQGFVAPVETTGSSEPITSVPQKGGLSGGAIAGIVIGVIAGVIILLLILACCCLSAGIKGIWGLVAGKKKDSRRGSRTEVIETRRHSTRYGGSNVSRRESHGGWYGGAAGGRGSGRGSKANEKHSSHKKEAAGLAVGAAALWAGMKFWNKKKEVQKRRSGTYYSYTESYTATTDSSSSSGGRTRQSRRSRR